MKLLVTALALAAAAPSGEAADSKGQALVLRPKSAIATPQSHQYAPFVSPSVSDVELELLPRRDERQEAMRSSCSGESSLCYDPASGRIVYKPAREFMPDLPGLRRENISVKRDRIVFRYSF